MGHILPLHHNLSGFDSVSLHIQPGHLNELTESLITVCE